MLRILGIELCPGMGTPQAPGALDRQSVPLLRKPIRLRPMKGPPSMSYLETSDATGIYFEEYGTGQPIVFVHGWPLSASMWDYQIVPLSRAGFRCIAYDRRGFGRSDKPDSAYDYATLAGDLAELIEELDLTDVTLVGFSMGGGEVIEYLARQNQQGRVSRAMLISSVVPGMMQTLANPDGVPMSVFDEMREGIENDRPAFLTDFAETFFGVGMLSKPVSDAMLASTCEVAMTASPVATLHAIRTFSETDFRADLPAISTPVRIIHGDADATVPIATTGQRAAELLPNADLKVYEGAPHGLFYTHRHDLNRDIAAFASDGRIVLMERAA